MSVINLFSIIFFLAFGLTMFGIPFAILVAQISALILGIVYLVQAIKAS